MTFNVQSSTFNNASDRSRTWRIGRIGIGVRHRLFSGVGFRSGNCVCDSIFHLSSLIIHRCAVRRLAAAALCVLGVALGAATVRPVSNFQLDGRPVLVPAVQEMKCAGKTTALPEKFTVKLPEGEKRRGDKKAGSKKPLPADYGADAAKVYNLLSHEPLHSDEICAETNLPPSKVMGILTQLELDGFAEQTEGKNYILA